MEKNLDNYEFETKEIDREYDGVTELEILSKLREEMIKEEAFSDKRKSSIEEVKEQTDESKNKQSNRL